MVENWSPAASKVKASAHCFPEPNKVAVDQLKEFVIADIDGNVRKICSYLVGFLDMISKAMGPYVLS